MFSCVLVGQGSLLVRCGDLLLATGHTIRGVVGSDPTIRDWAVRHNLVWVGQPDALESLLGDQAFDYLFSIVNPLILRADLLRLPLRAAINYHDAPLPRYAGMHSTSWAILQREAEHGVSWHVMTEQIDAGPILAQRRMPIDPAETALTLNAKCYEAALLCFAELLPLLDQGCLQPIEQDQTQRSLFAQSARPPAAGIIRWTDTAEQIDALMRALEFGPYPNPLTLPKLLLGEQFYLVEAFDARPDLPYAPPGMIIALNADALVVGTATTPLALRRLRTLDGLALEARTAAAALGLCPGDQLPLLDEGQAKRIRRLHQRLARHEPFWATRLSDLQPATVAELLGRIEQPEAALPWSTSPRQLGLALPMVAGESPVVVALAALAALLLRLGQRSLLDLGLRVAELERMLGPAAPLFAPIVPLRLTLVGRPDFTAWCQDVRAALAEARTRCSYPHDLRWRDPALRGQSDRLPIAVVETAADLPDLDCDLALVVAPDGQMFCRYNQAVLAPTQAELLLRRLGIFAANLAAQPDRPVADVPLLDRDEQVQLLHGLNHTATAVEWRPLHQLIADQARRTPNAAALIDGERRLGYAELDAHANQLAQLLRRHGVGPEVRVGLCLDRSFDMVIALLAVLKAGGAYVPFDPDYPLGRLQWMLADAEPQVLITRRGLRGGHRQPDAVLGWLAGLDQPQVIWLDQQREQIAGLPTWPPDGSIHAEQLAYIIYTSGSSGRPKGVLVSHSGLANLAIAQRRGFALGPGDRQLQFASWNFDASVAELASALANGASLVLAQPDELLPGLALTELIRAQQISHVTLPPSLLARLSEQSLPSVRTLVVAGEACPPDLARRWSTSRRFVNAYGPTELTVCATLGTYAPDDPVLSIGRPIDNTRVYVLDRALQPLPVGVAGELYLGGVGLARGYLGRPDLTADRFLPDPWSGVVGARLYRSGDLGRWRADGTLEFLGRADQQIKLRGHRIEPGEIEALLAGHPLVQSAAVVAYPARDGLELVAYLVPQTPATDPQPLAEQLRAYLAEQLPGYMVPGMLYVLEALPLTPNGKIDRQRLPPPSALVRSSSGAVTAPHGPLEEVVAAIWAEALGRGQVGTNQDFFALGGHSLVAAAIIAEVKLRLMVDLPLSSLFLAPTVAAFCRLVIEHEPTPGAANLIARLRSQIDALSSEEVQAILSDLT